MDWFKMGLLQIIQTLFYKYDSVTVLTFIIALIELKNNNFG